MLMMLLTLNKATLTLGRDISQRLSVTPEPGVTCGASFQRPSSYICSFKFRSRISFGSMTLSFISRHISFRSSFSIRRISGESAEQMLIFLP